MAPSGGSLRETAAAAMTVINIPEFDGVSRNVAEVWTLTKGGHTAVCSLFTHPIGGEVRLDLDGELHRSEASRRGMDLIDLALEWKAGFIEKGWTS